MATIIHFYIGQDSRLADTCIAASANVLRLMKGWNVCRNTEWVMCALQGKLPGQSSKTIRFAKAPRSLKLEEFWQPPCWLRQRRLYHAKLRGE